MGLGYRVGSTHIWLSEREVAERERLGKWRYRFDMDKSERFEAAALEEARWARSMRPDPDRYALH